MEKVELVIVGAETGELGAAIESVKYGVKVTVFDENNRPDGSYSNKYTNSLVQEHIWRSKKF